MPINRWYLLAIVVLIAACGKTPKEQAIAGFSEQCYSTKTPEAKRFCDCMVEHLDAAIPSQVFNDPDADPVRLITGLAEMTRDLTPTCKDATRGP